MIVGVPSGIGDVSWVYSKLCNVGERVMFFFLVCRACFPQRARGIGCELVGLAFGLGDLFVRLGLHLRAGLGELSL